MWTPSHKEHTVPVTLELFHGKEWKPPNSFQEVSITFEPKSNQKSGRKKLDYCSGYSCKNPK